MLQYRTQYTVFGYVGLSVYDISVEESLNEVDSILIHGKGSNERERIREGRFESR